MVTHRWSSQLSKTSIRLTTPSPSHHTSGQYKHSDHCDNNTCHSPAAPRSPLRRRPPRDAAAPPTANNATATTKPSHARTTTLLRFHELSSRRTSAARLAICQPATADANTSVNQHTPAHNPEIETQDSRNGTGSPHVRSCPPLQVCPRHVHTVLVFYPCM